jgi:hypothetical protein
MNSNWKRIVPLVVVFCSTGVLATDKENRVNSDEIFQNPVDKKTYVAPGGWTNYQPNQPHPIDPTKKVRTNGVRLLVSDADLTARTTVRELTTFIQEAERLANATLGQSISSSKLLVQFTCSPNGHKVEIAHQGEVDPALLQSFYDAVLRAKKLLVSSGAVTFQLELSVN